MDVAGGGTSSAGRCKTGVEGFGESREGVTNRDG